MTALMLSPKILLIESDPIVVDQTRAAPGAADGGSYDAESVGQLYEGLEPLSKKGIGTVLLALSLPEIQKKSWRSELR